MADANFTTRRALLKAAPALALVGAVPTAVEASDTVAVPRSLVAEMLRLAIPHSPGAGREWEVVPKDATDRLRELTGAAVYPPAGEPSAIMALFRRHQELTAAAATHPVDDDEELERLFYRERDQIEEEMDALPALTAQDMAAKMVVAHSYGDHSCLSYDRNLVWREARALIGA